MFAQNCGGGGTVLTLTKNMVKLLHMDNKDSVIDVIQHIGRDSAHNLQDAVLAVLVVLIAQRCARQWLLMKRKSYSMVVSGVNRVNIARALMMDIEDYNTTTTTTIIAKQKSHNKN